MKENKRPLSVTVVACLFLLVGAVGFVYHFRELLPLQRDGTLVELTEFLAFVSGAFMLRGQNWARWLALAWMAFHVVISAVPPFRGLIVHVLIFGGITWLLLRSDAAGYFRGQKAGTS